jgi:hypothetical protein
MLGSRKRSGHGHDDSSHWAGPGLVRMVCKSCGRVSLDLNEPGTETGTERELGVDALHWLTAVAVR